MYYGVTYEDSLQTFTVFYVIFIQINIFLMMIQAASSIYSAPKEYGKYAYFNYFSRVSRYIPISLLLSFFLSGGSSFMRVSCHSQSIFI
jgi:hypothetical protein